jgi:hypothetical protein
VFDAVRVARLYRLVLGIGLLLEGASLLVLEVVGVMPGDARHNALHAIWGLAILGLLATSRGPWQPALVLLVFGVFYTALAIAGVVADRPAELMLGPGENFFHFTVGPLALLLGLLAARQLSGSAASSSASNAATVSSAASGSASGGLSDPR